MFDNEYNYFKALDQKRKAAPRDGLSIVMTAVRWDHEAPLTRGGTPRKQESGSQLPTTAA